MCATNFIMGTMHYKEYVFVCFTDILITDCALVPINSKTRETTNLQLSNYFTELYVRYKLPPLHCPTGEREINI